VHVSSITESEVRVTLEALVDISNQLLDRAPADIRGILADAGFTRAPGASAASLERLAHRLAELQALVHELPDLATDGAVTRVNEELTEITIEPSVVDHDGVGPHIHWTPATATFDDQVISDVLMALALELCDHGTSRFGRCGAADCERLFYDTTRNHSRRFCSDRRCAARTHTADHRARQRADS